MELGLTGKVAVVTGASKGIGLAITNALVNEGVHVVAAARDTSPTLDELANQGTVHPVTVDLASVEGPGELIATTLTEMGRIDILVNNVGAVTPRLNGFLLVNDDQWLRSLTINLMAAVRTTRAALPAMLASASGAVIFTSSLNAFLPDPLVIDYGAAKAGLTNFAKALSKDVGPRGIRVNTISPGPVATELWMGDNGMAVAVAGAGDRDPDHVASEAASRAVTGRFTTPHEIANLAVFLASSQAAGNITGANFVIDGGYTAELR